MTKRFCSGILKSAIRRLKAANFPNHKILDSFDFSAQPSVNKVQISELMRCEYIDRKGSVLLIENPGASGDIACDGSLRKRKKSSFLAGDRTYYGANGSSRRQASDAAAWPAVETRSFGAG